MWSDPPNNQPSREAYATHLLNKEAMPLQEALYSSTTNIPPPNTFQPHETQPTNPPPPTTEILLLANFPRHGCSQCETTAHINERCQKDIRELQDEMRFILNHILERLNTISHPPQP